ncbi:cytochrome P450 [Pleurotus eryngii]|uniref:Cytochrome P450 n=1 Tax=Pleurotus eryngii TaxID=5323 RepID=A0A9P6A3Y8_PLEER|nr:cytochrome P450 [Pleurotus eryngii]
MGQLSSSFAPVSGVVLNLLSYWVFKRYEPNSVGTVAALLLGVPVLVSNIVAQHPIFSRCNYTHTIVILIVTHNVLLACFTVAYRLSPFHPLAAFPGPAYAKLTKFTVAWVTSKGKQYQFYHALHDKYGDVVRIGPNELSIRHVDAVAPILGHDGLPKGPFWDYRADAGSHPPLIAIREPGEHLKRRKPWNRAFSRIALQGYEKPLLGNIERLTEALDARTNQMVDMTIWMGYFALDFMGDIVFGQPYRILESGMDAQGVSGILEDGVRSSTITGQIPWAIPILRWLRITAYDRMKQYARSSALRRLEDTERAKDIFHYLSDEQGVQSVQRPLALVASDAGLAMIAGSDTTTATLSAMWYCLLSNNVAYKRLQQEIDSAFPTDELPTNLGTMASMQYLNACINETLRLFPALLSGTQRSVLPGTGGKMIHSFFVPEGTQVFVPAYSLHRDPRCFSPIPDAFWPDRWLPEGDRLYPPSISKNDPFVLNAAALITFSHGPASCVGKSLALTVLRAVVCSLVHTFDVKPSGDIGNWEEHMEDYFTAKCGPLMAVLSRREEARRV